MSQLVKFTKDDVLNYHKENRGKISINVKTQLNNVKDLSLAYTPGVAEICLRIQENSNSIYEYTNLGNSVAVVTDGTAVLGLGNIGPYPALPVMEGKCVLFKKLAGVDAFPICLNTKVPEKIIESIKYLEPSFSGINLEDIKAPECFEIETELKKEMNIPIFHDDQHGTAIVLVGGIINALKVVGKKYRDIKVTISGAGAAGMAVAKILLRLGVKDLILCDSRGIIYEGRKEGMNKFKNEIAKKTNYGKITGTLKDAMRESDVFIGVSVANIVNKEMVKSMNDDAIVFALANPVPEIMPEEAEKAGAKIIGSGRSDYPNQINNVMGFPGIFRGALDVRARQINEDMKLAAANAIADLMPKDKLCETYVIVNPLNPKIVPNVAFAVAETAMKTGVARIKLNDEELKKKIENNISSV
ncbi:MAG: NAD(P)-dependent malic enzyme [Candidatus Helarchaeota archaeon]